jgi:two-component system sensor histidine kinase/response regulator
MLKFQSMDDERKFRYVKDIKRSAEINFELVENLLTWARSQTGRLNIKPMEFDMREFAEDVIEIYEQAAKDKGVSINNLVEEKVKAFVDEPTINTVLRNLISNAVKFTSDGDQITVKASMESTNLILSVSDTGTGMPEEKASDLFSNKPQTSTDGTKKEKRNRFRIVALQRAD